MSAGPFLDQSRARGLLEQALFTGEIPPALLFSGPPGVGKEEAALELARALNCVGGRGGPQSDLFGQVDQGVEQDAEAEPEGTVLGGCGTCTACERIGRYSHPDVIVRLPLPRPKKKDEPADPTEALEYKAQNPYADPDIPGANLTIGIADVRAVIGQLAYAPVEGGKRVVIFREAEMMTVEAQNALLKSLEEPPAHTHFILTTSRPNRLLPTVRSRCRTAYFGPLPRETITSYLEDQGIGSPDGLDIAALARGSMKRAIEIARGAVPGREEALQLLSWASEGRKRKALAWAADYTFKSGKGAQVVARQVLDELVSLTRDIAVLQAGSGVPLLNPDMAEFLTTVVEKAPGGGPAKALTAVFEARGEVDRFINLALIYATLFEALRPLGE